MPQTRPNTWQSVWAGGYWIFRECARCAGWPPETLSLVFPGKESLAASLKTVDLRSPFFNSSDTVCPMKSDCSQLPSLISCQEQTVVFGAEKAALTAQFDASQPGFPSNIGCLRGSDPGSGSRCRHFCNCLFFLLLIGQVIYRRVQDIFFFLIVRP